MRRIALLALGALLASPAGAQERSCRDIRILVNANGGNFRGVALSMEPGIGLSVAVQGRRLDLPAAHDCDMNVDRGGDSSVGCEWEAATSAEAGALYDRIVARINPCVSRPLEAGTPFAATGSRIVQSHSGSFVAGRRGTDLSITLFEHDAVAAGAPGGPRPVRYVVALWVALDMSREVEPEEEEAGGGS
jgi:hypothetical protein